MRRVLTKKSLPSRPGFSPGGRRGGGLIRTCLMSRCGRSSIFFVIIRISIQANGSRSSAGATPRKQDGSLPNRSKGRSGKIALSPPQAKLAVAQLLQIRLSYVGAGVGMRNKAVITGIPHGRVEEPVDNEEARVFIEF